GEVPAVAVRTLVGAHRDVAVVAALVLDLLARRLSDRLGRVALLLGVDVAGAAFMPSGHRRAPATRGSRRPCRSPGSDRVGTTLLPPGPRAPIVPGSSRARPAR